MPWSTRKRPPSEEIATEEIPEEKAGGGEIGLDGPFKLGGISVDVQEKLRSSGYLSVVELREAVPDDLMMIDGIDKDTAERICDAVRK